MIVGSVSAHLATERALELFASVQQADYVGWKGGVIGPKGHDESVLAGYEIVDDPLGAKDAAPIANEDGEICLHTNISPYDDGPTCGACEDCGEEFELSGFSEAAPQAAVENIDKEATGNVAAERSPVEGA